MFSKILKGAKGTLLRNEGTIGQVAFDSIFGILNEVPGLNEVTALLETFEHLGLDATRFNVDPGLEDGGLDLAKNIMSALHNEGNITDPLKNDLKAHHIKNGHTMMTDKEIDSKLDKLTKLIQNINQKQYAAAPAAAPKAALAAAPAKAAPTPKAAPAPKAAPKAAAPAKAAPKTAAAGGNKKKTKKSRKHKKRKNKITRKRRYKPKKKITKKTIRKSKKSRKRRHKRH